MGGRGRREEKRGEGKQQGDENSYKKETVWSLLLNKENVARMVLRELQNTFVSHLNNSLSCALCLGGKRVVFEIDRTIPEGTLRRNGPFPHDRDQSHREWFVDKYGNTVSFVLWEHGVICFRGEECRVGKSHFILSFESVIVISCTFVRTASLLSSLACCFPLVVGRVISSLKALTGISYSVSTALSVSLVSVPSFFIHTSTVVWH